MLSSYKLFGRNLIASAFTAVLLLSGAQTFAQDTTAETETAAADITPLTAEQIETLFKHPILANVTPEDYTPEELVSLKTAVEESDAFFAALTPVTGEVNLPSAGVTLTLGDEHYFLNKQDSKKILEDYWNNPEDSSLLGMIFAKGTNQDLYDYAIEVNFEKTGYVSDEDAASIDYDELLASMKKSTRESNPARKKLGYAEVQLEDWAATPKYDAENHRLHWAKLLSFEGEETNTLNYNLRYLGRKGVLQFNFIADAGSLAVVDKDLPKVSKIASFNPGHSYSDFNSATDDVAAYGVAGLIAGGVAAKKLGLLGLLLVFLKKGWVLIIAAFAFIGKIFKRKDA